MAIATMQAAVASTLTLSPYIVSNEGDKSSSSKKGSRLDAFIGSVLPTLTRGSLQAVRITALVCAILATAGFIAALAVASFSTPVVILGSTALLTAGICVFAFSLLARQASEGKDGSKATDNQADTNSTLPTLQKFSIEVQADKQKGKARALEEKTIDVLFHTEEQVKVSRMHQIARITAVALVVLGALAVATAAVVTTFALAPVLPWAPLIALGGTIAVASGISIFALSILTVYGKQRIPTNKHTFDQNGTGVVIRDKNHAIRTTLGDLEKPEFVYLERAEYKKYLQARQLLAKNIRSQQSGGIV